MNTIYKYRRITTAGPDGTTIYFKNSENENRAIELAEVDGWYYVSVPELAQMPEQPVEIEWQKVTLDSMLRLSIIANSRTVQLINQSVVDSIRSLYSIDDELKLLRTAPSAEFDLYNTYVENCRVIGKNQKTDLGL